MKHILCNVISNEVLAFFAELLPQLSKCNQVKLLNCGEMFVSNKKSNEYPQPTIKSKIRKCKKIVKKGDAIAKIKK